MDDPTLHHLCKSLHSAESAWRAASTTGAEDITQISNAIHTLQYHAYPHSSPPPPGALTTLLSETRARLDHLQTTLRRLRSVIPGVERWRAELSHSKLAELVDEFLQGLREDHALKMHVVEELREAETGGIIDAERWLAVWTESTPRFARPDAAFVQAFVEAEASLKRYVMVSTPGKEAGQRVPQEKTLSPALAMLKRRSLGGA